MSSTRSPVGVPLGAGVLAALTTWCLRSLSSRTRTCRFGLNRASDPRALSSLARREVAAKTPEKSARTSKNISRTAPEDAPLSKYQVLVLGTLSMAKTPITRSEISEQTGITAGFCDMLGQKDENRRNPRSLWTRKLVSVTELDTGQLTYRINAAGRKALKSTQSKN